MIMIKKAKIKVRAEHRSEYERVIKKYMIYDIEKGRMMSVQNNDDGTFTLVFYVGSVKLVFLKRKLRALKEEIEIKESIERFMKRWANDISKMMGA